MIIQAVQDATVSVSPVLVLGLPGHPMSRVLAFYDEYTGAPIWRDSHYEWHVTSPDRDADDAETISGIHAGDEATWRHLLNARLADYGMRLGEYVHEFDFTVRRPSDPVASVGHEADGFMLEPAEQ